MVVPKVEGPGDLEYVERLLDGAEAASGRLLPLRIQVLIETPAGLARVREIAGSSDRVDTLILGYADLGAALGGNRSLDAWLPAQHALLLAAREAGLQAIDGPHLGIELDERFHAASARTVELGFDGRWVIHPQQVEHVNEALTPTSVEVERAHAVVAALDDAGEGAVALDGQMLDEAVRVAALRVLARAARERSRRPVFRRPVRGGPGRRRSRADAHRRSRRGARRDRRRPAAAGR